MQATPRIGAGNDADADPEAARAAASPAGMAQDDHSHRGEVIPKYYIIIYNAVLYCFLRGELFV